MTEYQTRKFLDRHSHLLPKRSYGRLGFPAKWPSDVIETIRALLGQGYVLADVQSDWLARYLKEGTHGSN